jgi:hypothetical protein
MLPTLLVPSVYASSWPLATVLHVPELRESRAGQSEELSMLLVSRHCERSEEKPTPRQIA